jgi:hypothetical protein
MIQLLAKYNDGPYFILLVKTSFLLELKYTSNEATLMCCDELSTAEDSLEPNGVTYISQAETRIA